MLWYAALGGLVLVNYCKKLAIIPNRWSQDPHIFRGQSQAKWHHRPLMPSSPDAHVQSYASILISFEVRLADGVCSGDSLCVLLFLNQEFRPKKGPKWDAAIISPWLPMTTPRPPQHLPVGSIQGQRFIIHGCGALSGLRGGANMRAQMGTNSPFSGSWRKDTKNRTRCATLIFLPQRIHHNRANDVVMG